MSNEAKLNSRDALNFILAGNAILTLVSEKTGQRYTYQVKESKRSNGWFVSLLRGPDNTRDYTYLGFIFLKDGFKITAKSRMPADAQPVKAFSWTFAKLWSDAEPAGVEIWHVGKCGCCGRQLTVPESIADGIGPTCKARGRGRRALPVAA